MVGGYRDDLGVVTCAPIILWWRPLNDRHRIQEEPLAQVGVADGDGGGGCGGTGGYVGELHVGCSPREDGDGDVVLNGIVVDQKIVFWNFLRVEPASEPQFYGELACRKIHWGGGDEPAAARTDVPETQMPTSEKDVFVITDGKAGQIALVFLRGPRAALVVPCGDCAEPFAENNIFRLAGSGGQSHAFAQADRVLACGNHKTGLPESYARHHHPHRHQQHRHRHRPRRTRKPARGSRFATC